MANPTHAETIQSRLFGIAERAEKDANEALGQDRGREAIQLLTAAQRDLRDLKREITDAERQIRLEAQSARQAATARSQTSAVFGKTVKRAVAQSSAVEKNRISQRQTRALAEYAPLKTQIDQLIADMDRSKAEIRQASGGGSSAAPSTQAPAPPPPPPPAKVPAQWSRDPSGRHELRWWDGAKWSEHVSDQGTPGVDPVPPR